MQAAVFYAPHQPLKIEEYPIPKPATDEVLIKVSACGVCHTDLHYIDHGVPTFKNPPLILGHEISGTVAEIGSNVKNLKVNDRVLLPAVLTCGACEFCRTGRENICKTMIMFGNHIDGGYAEFVKAPAKDVFILPQEIPLEEGCIIADAISTPYHAVKNRAQVKPGDVVAVFGCGGVGINLVQLSHSCGATVIAIDIIDKKLDWAKQFGATYILNASKFPDIAKEIRKITNGGVDIAFEAIGNPTTMTSAYNSLRKGGRLCVVGYSDKDFLISSAKLMFFEMEIVGSLGCRPVDYPRLIEMARIGKIKVSPLVTHRFTLSEINSAFESLRKGEPLRAIVVMKATDFTD
ncbi:MAG: zinc-binding dehydrogenase [Planctomycetota bacterium]|nr:zinc-binding dehydrogenase [Planctomycetota bacterium]MDI6788452.1 zinc-binding dehydrogenase [Planctomycetota bacterium]